MRAALRLAASLALLLLFPTAAHAESVAFSKGSLIIPMQLNYQSPSGIPSAYGLIWRMLQKNDDPAWKDSPVTVYLVNSDSKQSPNRCMPTDKDVPPSNAGDTRWVDGCDFSITANSTGKPVKKVDISASTTTGGIAVLDSFSTNNTFTITGGSVAYDVRDPNGSGGWVCGSGLVNTNITACTQPVTTTTRNAFKTKSGGVWVCPSGYAAANFGACSKSGTSCSKGYSATVNASGTAVCAIASGGTCASGYSFSSTFAGCQLVTQTCNNGYTLTGDSAGAAICADPSPSSTCGTSSLPGTTLNTAFPGCSNTPPGINPAFTSVTVDATVKTVRFMGGPAIIDAADVPAFINRMKNDPDLRAFWNSCSANNASTTCHNVNVYQANADFVAPVLNVMNKIPPKIAVLNAGSGVSSGILTTYLANAGLNFPGAGGCPAGTRQTSCQICALNVAGVQVCSSAPGQIYDSFHANLDLASTATYPDGLLNARDATTGKRIYSIFWTPHWSGSSTSNSWFDNGDGASSELENVINNITKFADDQTGMLAECASLETYEGSCTNPPCTGTSGWSIAPPPGAGGNFMSTNGLYTNGLSNQSWVGRNCTDPDITPTAGGTPNAACIYFDYPADPYVQVADMVYQGTSGHVHNYKPQTAGGSAYGTGVKRLARTFSPTNANDVDWDFFTSTYKDSNSKKALILYLAGHSYASNLAGNRITLNTLLNLGFGLISAETARSGPVALKDPVSGNPAILQASYEAVTVTGTPATYKNFNPLAGSRWTFPFNSGHLRLHQIANLKSGRNFYGEGTDWAAEELMPAAGSRNLFTMVGGNLTTSSFTATDGSTVNPPNGVLQSGWTPVKFHADALDPANAACVDNLQVARQTKTKKDGTSEDRWGLVPGADGVCDLQQLLQYSDVSPGTNYGTDTLIANRATWAADRTVTQQMVQMVRGYCFANGTAGDGQAGVDGDPSGQVVLSPTSSTDCNKGSVSENKPVLGGFVNSAPVVVGPSKYVKTKDDKARPTVAYVGGLDGQLHAFYVGGGAGYKGPVGSDANGNLPSVNTPPTAGTGTPRAFSSPAALPFDTSTVKPGQELWAFIPPSQLPFLKTNDAAVDGTVVVVDVFGDFLGTGTRTWRTVLLATTGPQGNDLFAMDVTNPLRPNLLWFLGGSDGMKPLPRNNTTSKFFPYVPADTDTGYDADTLSKKALWWKNVGFEVSAGTTRVKSKYLFPPSADEGRDQTGLYNYARLGGARSIQTGVLLVDGKPRFEAFVATNYGPNTDAGAEVFAVDLVTGQKQWQWEQAYATDPTTREYSNVAPNGVALVDYDQNNFIDTLYVGDMEGRMWELDARWGMNKNVVRQGPSCSDSAPCSFALVDTNGSAAAPQPITTQPAVFLIPSANNTTGPLAAFAGELAIAFGTGGAGFVADNDPVVTGQVHLALLNSSRRWDVVNGGRALGGTTAYTPAEVKAKVDQFGIAQEPSPFPLTKDSATPIPVGHRFYGPMSTVNGKLYFDTAGGKVGFADGTAKSVAGQTLSVDLFGTAGGSLSSPLTQDAASTGQVLVVYDPAFGTKTITTTTKGISVKSDNDTRGRADASQRLMNKTAPVRLISWMRRLIYH